MASSGQVADYVMGVVGAGAMGRGIAQIAATGGMRVLLCDGRHEVALEARQFINKMFDRAVEKGSMQQSDVSAAMARIEVIGGIPALASCDLVVEAVIEDLDLKKTIIQGAGGGRRAGMHFSFQYIVPFHYDDCRRRDISGTNRGFSFFQSCAADEIGGGD